MNYGTIVYLRKIQKYAEILASEVEEALDLIPESSPAVGDLQHALAQFNAASCNEKIPS